MNPFSHLHCHTQYSLLDGASTIPGMVAKAKADGMPAVAITDHGNMFGAFTFVDEAKKKGIKPIVGCEFYLVDDHTIKKFSKEDKEVRYHQLFLAKNNEGYHNLAKLCSAGFLDGYYGNFPRIDKNLIKKHYQGLIATTCCIGAEVPRTILDHSVEKAEENFKWWLDIFGEDYYIELQRHGLAEQDKVNEVLLGFAAKYGVKIICTNDSHYLDKEQFEAHDSLLCINTGTKKATPKGYGKGFRFGFENDEFYFKTQDEMGKLFSDLPEALDNTFEIVEKVEVLTLEVDKPMLPRFPLPDGFNTPIEYLEFLSYQGAKKRYKIITEEIDKRIRFELDTIDKMGFAGYFLIVSDFIKAGRDEGVMVGPGRGSAAGSVIAYCTGITNIDPIAYSLLFERFLNPERVSMPDIDIDFDDANRQKVIDYVINKYGRTQVAQIVTFGCMAPKMAIKDVARVMDLPLAEANFLAKLVPDKPGTDFKTALKESEELNKISQEKSARGEVIRQAKELEGSVRNTGVHAAGVIIAPDDIREYIPVARAKDTEMMVTQFEGSLIERAGMLKMDFLGLRTLTILKDCLKLVKKNKNIDIDLDAIPLDDPNTFEIFQKGETVAVFQFESPGMRTYLRDLKPTNIEDLIAMNALYRPGPMSFIPNFINRKQGNETIEYPHELLEPILKYSFGIMVYQEQIMQAAQIMAGYSLGGADLLRRAMGKKDKEKMAKERIKFTEGAAKLHGIDSVKANQVFDVMEKFAEYGFNRSHSAAYAVVAYQTAYLKAHFPSEFMAAVLTNEMGDLKKITFFLEECRRMRIQVLGPDINESGINFEANPAGYLRFGLAAIKGVGEAAVEALIREREANGPYEDVFDLSARLSGNSGFNRKALEALVFGGAFDSFTSVHRAQYMQVIEGDEVFIDRIIKYGNRIAQAKEAAQTSLFGMAGGGDAKENKPRIPPAPEWSSMDRLRYEREVLGFFLSGHPLDQYQLELNELCNASLTELKLYNDLLDDLPSNTKKEWSNLGPNQRQELLGEEVKDLMKNKNIDIRVGAMVVKKEIRTTQKGTSWCKLLLEDYDGNFELALFGRDYEALPAFVEEGAFIYIRGNFIYRAGTGDKIDKWEFKPHIIELLETQKDKQFKSIEIVLEAEELNLNRIENLKSLLGSESGQIGLRFLLKSKGQKPLQVKFFSSQKVAPSVELTNSIKSLGFDFNFQKHPLETKAPAKGYNNKYGG